MKHRKKTIHIILKDSLFWRGLDNLTRLPTDHAGKTPK